jgi:hypothetical protein
MEEPAQFIVQDEQVLPHDETDMDEDDREQRLREELADWYVEGAGALPVHDLNGSHDHDEAKEGIGGSHHEVPARIHDGVGRAQFQRCVTDEVDERLNRATEPSQDVVQEIDNELINEIHLTLAFAVLTSHRVVTRASHEGSVAGALG